MSRIAAFASTARGAALRFEAVRGMLGAMPGGDASVAALGGAALGWGGRAGGGLHQAPDVAVALDGELFNFDELAGGCDPAPRNDAEAIAALYRRHGFEGMLAQLSGDFALVLADARTQTLWCARDRLGVKPFYYAAPAGEFACGSQPAALLRAPGADRRVNRRYVALIAGSHYRTFDNAPQQSPFEAIAQLPAGCFLEVKAGASPRLARYWTLERGPAEGANEDELTERYRALLLGAVKRRLARAGRAAFTLSGGMDSSSVLCCAAEATGRKQQAVSSVYTDPTYDERAEIRDVVEARVEHWQPVEIGKDIDIFAEVAQLVAVHNEPVATATWLSHAHVCAELRSRFDGLFGGLGGDELNAGEYEYFPMHFADLRAAGRTEELAAEVAHWARYHDHAIYRKDAEAAQRAMERLTVAGSRGEVRPDRERLLKYAGAVNRDYFDLSRFAPEMEHPFGSFLANRAYQDLTRETTPCCLRAEDRQATAAGLRRYDPFLDHELVEFMFAVPGRMKIRDGVTKWLLRRAMRGILPEATRTRVKKTGWNAPAHLWFSGARLRQLRDLVASRRFRERGIYDIGAVQALLDEHERIVASGEARENHMMFLWQLVNLDAWLSWCEDMRKEPQ